MPQHTKKAYERWRNGELKPYSKCQPVCWVLSKTTGRPGVLQGCGGVNPGGVMEAASMALPGHRTSQLSHTPSSAAVTVWSLADKSLCLIQNHFLTQSWLSSCPCLSKREKDSPDQWCRRGSMNSLKHAQQFVFFLIFTHFQVHGILSYF